MNKFGEDVLRKSFHPDVERLGWEECFKKTFWQSSAEFAIEFERFMDLPLSEQIKILPAYELFHLANAAAVWSSGEMIRGECEGE